MAQISKFDNFLSRLSDHAEASKSLEWSGTLKDYIEIVTNNPKIHMTAHQRVLRMIDSRGVDRDESGNIVKYKFFEEDLFGVDEPIHDLMSYLRAAASGSEVSRRILLMYGPTSSGKSQLAILLKRGLEQFSKTDEGATFSLSESPMHEDPLCAIPEDLRHSFHSEYGIKIDGNLSPIMDLVLKEKYHGDFMKLPVKRTFFSERGRIGIGTFVPSDKKSQDISELVGSIDLSTVGEYGSESDPRAYRFDGELNVANRGIMEFVEMLKVDQKFLYVLLTLAQEKNIKTGRFPLIWADEFVVAHTNFTEFERFLAKDEMEALHDRTIVVKVPYNLSVDSEVKIYEKLINQANFEGRHIAPHTLTCAAMFAILSRLKESNNQGLSLLKKMKMYNDEDVEGFTKAESSKFKKEFDDEGMVGVSPRYVINRISSKLSEDNLSSITPLDIVRSLKDGLKSNPKVDKKESERLENVLLYVLEEYEKMAKNDVQKAFFVNFEDEIKNLLSNYMQHAEAFLDGGQVSDEWGNTVEPSEPLMRSIEEKVGISESGKRSFRQEIFRKMLRSNSNYQDHPALKDALEKQLFQERSAVIKMTVSSRNPDEEELKKINVVIKTLCEKYQYNTESANQLLRYVSSLMASK